MAYGLEYFPNRICNKTDNNLRNESFNCHRRPPFRTKIFQSSRMTSNFNQRNKAVNNTIIYTPILFCKPGFYNNFHPYSLLINQSGHCAISLSIYYRSVCKTNDCRVHRSAAISPYLFSLNHEAMIVLGDLELLLAGLSILLSLAERAHFDTALS